MAAQLSFKYSLMFLTISMAFFYAIAAAEMFSEKGNNYVDQNVEPWVPTTTSISKQIIVSQQPGYGNYTTIQAAIDQGVPENNAQWIHIFVTAGYYGEQIIVPESKPYIFLEGDRGGSLVYFNCSGDIFNATLSVKANNFLAKKMIFKNMMDLLNLRRGQYDYKERTQAVAASVEGDKIAFIQCAFVGVQDTLFDVGGRHYFYQCYIEGYVDFIFGRGQSVYEGCHIYLSTGDYGSTGAGSITAQRRDSGNDPNGFVFKHCTVDGKAQAILGRPWGPYSRVVFFQSNFSDVIVPAGWDAWTYVGQEYNLEYAEIDCYGPGANTSQRVKWEKQLTQQQANELLGNGFINSDGWLQQLPAYH